MISEKNKSRISRKTLLKTYLTEDFSGRRKMIIRNAELLEEKKIKYVGNVED